jgi:elongation factor Tu
MRSMEQGMDSDTICVLAKVRLLPETKWSKRAIYRPNHNFFGPEDRTMTMGQINIPEGQVLLPGESMEVPITFINWPGLEGQIYPGREWRIQEGATLVGMGTIIEILSSHERR